MDILKEISVNILPDNNERCQCVGVSKNSSKKTIAHFINRKHAKKALISRKKLINNSLPNSNRLFTPSQSVFFPGDSCIAQLLSMIYDIQHVFDENSTVNVAGAFLDTSKAFDQVWHDGIIFTLKAYGVECERLSLLKNYKIILKIENKELFSMIKNKAWISTRITSRSTFVFNIHK